MKVLIDIGHPAHVHLFRNFSIKFIEMGHEILFTCREKEFESELLRAAGFKYISFGRHYRSAMGKIWGLLKFDFLILIVCLRYKPNILMSHGSIYAAHVAWFLRRPHISLEDSGNMEQVRLYLPFTTAIICPDILPKKFGMKEIRYKGYHELFYLHPDNFTPDISILDILGVKRNEKYFVIRFVAFKATHDKGHKGLDHTTKSELVKFLKSKGRVFISSEVELPEEFSEYKLSIPPSRIHDVLSYASLVISEGATMGSEAGVLGVPSIYINTIIRSYNEDLEKYGLVYNFQEDLKLIEKVHELLSNSFVVDYEARRNKMLADKINPTKFLVWFTNGWPNSFHYFKDNQSNTLYSNNINIFD